MNQVQKLRGEVNKLSIVKLQLLHHFLLVDTEIELSEKQIETLAHLGAHYPDGVTMSAFCSHLVTLDLYKNAQSPRNFIGQMISETDYVIKQGKKILLNIPSIACQGDRIFYQLTLIYDGV